MLTLRDFDINCDSIFPSSKNWSTNSAGSDSDITDNTDLDMFGHHNGADMTATGSFFDLDYVNPSRFEALESFSDKDEGHDMFSARDDSSGSFAGGQSSFAPMDSIDSDSFSFGAQAFPRQSQPMSTVSNGWAAEKSRTLANEQCMMLEKQQQQARYIQLLQQRRKQQLQQSAQRNQWTGALPNHTMQSNVAHSYLPVDPCAHQTQRTQHNYPTHSFSKQQQQLPVSMNGHQQQQQHFANQLSSNYLPNDQMMPSYVNGQHGNGFNNMTMSGLNQSSSLQTNMQSKIYQVQFKCVNRYFTVAKNAMQTVNVGDTVVVEADRGEDIGIVTDILPMKTFIERRVYLKGSEEDDNVIGRILRVAASNERQLLPLKYRDEESVLQLCRELAYTTYRLPLVIHDVEYQFDRHKLTIYYCSDSRVDFREFVRDLFSAYKARIWMKKLNPAKLPQLEQWATVGLATGMTLNNNNSSVQNMNISNNTPVHSHAMNNNTQFANNGMTRNRFATSQHNHHSFGLYR